MLKTLRKQKRLTHMQLSKLSGVSQSYISELERDYFKKSPTVTTIIALSLALDCNMVDLFLYFAKKEMEYSPK